MFNISKKIITKIPKSNIRHYNDPKVFGNRELVGYGRNGEKCYYDSVVYPMPSIRWKEDTEALKELREKEQMDWRCLTLEEKKQLYRTSFRQTFSEFNAPTGYWKQAVGIFLGVWGLALMAQSFMHGIVYDPLPESFNYENQKAQLIRMLQAEVNPIEGISSKWDYENYKWK